VNLTNILLTGASGQLGKELVKLRDYAYKPTHYELDFRFPEAVEKYFEVVNPTIILHAAAFTKTHELSEYEAYEAYRTNVIGTRNLVKYAKCPIIYISTESAITPYNFYVLTKMQGETEVTKSKYGWKILRTSFRSVPFEYDMACTDMLTIGDSVDVIAKLIDKEIDKPVNNKLYYLGTGAKTVYDLAKQTRPDVKPILRSDLPNYLPSFEELRNI
jgi:dTDP-4-dehydrorhamnose reductase